MPHLHDRYDFVVSAFIVHRCRRQTPKILLIYHKRYNEWLPIGGHIELDEDPQQALMREIKEECGLPVKILNPTPAIAHPGVKPIPTPSYVDVHRISAIHSHIAFVYFAVTNKLNVNLHEKEHREYAWVSRRQLNDIRRPLSKSIRFYCRMAFKAAAR